MAVHGALPLADAVTVRCMGSADGSDAEAGTALGAAAGKDLAAVGGLHAGTETVVALTLDIAGLVGALGGHGETTL